MDTMKCKRNIRYKGEIYIYMAKKRNTQHSIFTVLIGTIIIVLITIIFRVLFFAYDVITIYTTKYKQSRVTVFLKPILIKVTMVNLNYIVR